MPIFIDQRAMPSSVGGDMVGFSGGCVSVTGRIMWLLAPYFADGCVSIHRVSF